MPIVANQTGSFEICGYPIHTAPMTRPIRSKTA